MYVIFGANGHTGSVAAHTLLERGKKVRVVARDASKLSALRAKGAEVVTADVTDAAAVENALAGAEGAWLLCPPDNATNDLFARNRKITDNYAAALGKHRVKHAAFLSSVGGHLPSGTGPIATLHYAETKLTEVGTTLTYVRAAYFMENHLASAQPMKTQGVLPVFGGGEEYPFPQVATRDIGRIAAEALLAPPAKHEWIELSGPKEYSFKDVAAEASEILGRAVTPTVLPLDAVVPTYTQFGMSTHMAGLYREMIEAFGKGLGFEGNQRSMRGTVTLGEVLRPALRS